jgi:hypothetical protein
MKAAIEVLFQRRRFKGREEVERDIDEELRFHVELLTHEHQRQQMSPDQAEQAALKRFGNIDRIKDECLAISRRRRPVLLALKSFLLVIFLSGIAVRILSTALNTRRMGDLLIAIPILTGLLLYVRGSQPARFISEPSSASPLRLNEVQPLFTPYDDGMLTPVERLIADT